MRRVITTEIINYGFSSIGLLQILGNIISVRIKASFSHAAGRSRKNLDYNKKAETGFLREMFYNSVFEFPSMCFNFTKRKLYVICKLGFAPLLQENWIEINISRNGTKPQNYPEKFSNSNDAAFNGFTMVFGHFYVRVFLSKE